MLGIGFRERESAHELRIDEQIIHVTGNEETATMVVALRKAILGRPPATTTQPKAKVALCLARDVSAASIICLIISFHKPPKVAIELR